jgi:hypothetical protein
MVALLGVMVALLGVLVLLLGVMVALLGVMVALLGVLAPWLPGRLLRLQCEVIVLCMQAVALTIYLLAYVIPYMKVPTS